MNKKLASQQYAANQMGDPVRREARQERREARQATRGNGKSNDAVEVCTAKTAKEGKCGAYAGGGPSTGTVKEAKNTQPTSGGEKNKVLRPGTLAYKIHKNKMDKVRNNAAPMMNKTRKQKEVESQMGPPAPEKEKAPKQPAVTAASRKAAERKANAPEAKPLVKRGLFGRVKQRKTTKFTF